MIERLAPKAEKKSPKVPMLFADRFLAMIQDSVLAKVTNSQPDGQLQEFIISPDLLYEKILKL